MYHRLNYPDICKKMGKLALGVILLLLVGCTKQGAGPGMLAPGTQCILVQGVFEDGQFQPAPPLTVQDIFQSDGIFTIYNVVDAKGVVWQIPSDDLQVTK